ncbi:serine hydrolase [Pedobacter foliorum]|uniref:serine hydrolase domain-containing protein n=1 Tax=Pedobacter foliorum TaxID=2739058 RepID=UPI001565E949|nr:serine hydrolase domain-containing protein [Pedobacter foliorum]NRF40694.1 beta-lactamase family protein [Pedobacter foliorum]
MRIKKNRLRVICSMLLLLVVGFSVNAQDKQKEIERLIATYHKLGKFNGTILVAQQGKVLLERGYGFKNIRKGTRNDQNTIYQVASVTKPFTSAVVLKLVELGKLRLSDSLSKFYPDFSNGDSVTISHLLSHTSGISDTSQNITGGTEEKIFVEALKGQNLDFKPGTDWRYSNAGYILLGYIIEKVTGLSYYDAVRKYVFKPLRMRQSDFDFIKLKDRNKATGYWAFPLDGNANTAEVMGFERPRAAGAIYSTVGDLYKFHVGLQQGKVVADSLLAKAYTSIRANYGYGWFIDSVFRQKTVHHSGDIWGFRSEFARVPTDDICIVMLNNIQDVYLHVISLKILAILYEEPYQFPAENKVHLDSATLAVYEGDYQLRQGQLIGLKVDHGRLMSTTNITQEMYAQQKDVFVLDNGKEQLTISFERDTDGKVVSLSFLNTDKKMVCKKVK